MLAAERKYEYVTPELVLYVMCSVGIFGACFEKCGGKTEDLKTCLDFYLDDYMEESDSGNIEFSEGFGKALYMAQQSADGSGKGMVEVSHLIRGMFRLENSFAIYYIASQGVEEAELLNALSDAQEDINEFMNSEDDLPGDNFSGNADAEGRGDRMPGYAVCLNDRMEDVNPLIGREDEMERTIQILCRKDKNNPLHVGEPGVGKTAITYGLVKLINDDKVPDAIKGARVYALDLGGILAGSQYRGDFEKRLKNVLDIADRDEKPIIYIDEIHNLVGAGASGEGSMDAANILKPYLAKGHIRFIGATTFEEYKKHFEKQKSLVRRFQNVEIKEPTVEECILILEGLKKSYESFHGVKYGKGVIEHAVRMSAKHITERFLPDKAIDLIDEAGAYRRIHPLEQKRQSVSKDLINHILTKICRVSVESVESEEARSLADLEKRMLSKVFGQDEAVSQVVNAVKFSRAGLLEDNKPLASLLFVGPTGVGKTEIAKSLAKELGIKLIRFDMSEYGEKHSIAKLIGSPAGYVGYEEGGLLTEEVRKNPSAVLLLDEIEKAHPDIFHVLLQVMDYATLTDNQGRKADFRNVIIIMTSNAGASLLGKPGLGFGAEDVSRDVVMEAVKKTFQPEFRNRLSKIVAFNSISREMAEMIAGKKLSELSELLTAKKVELTFSDEAVRLLCNKGVSREYGARELDRVINAEIKPLLVDEILFGRFRKGGKCKITVREEEFTVV